MALTIKDIARESGFAVSTVSRALNNHPDVSAQTKEKIAQIVAQHGFVPNSNARQLKMQQTAGIVLVVKGAFNLFFAAILEQMQALITDAGYIAEVQYLDEDADEVLVAHQLQRERKPLGFIFLGGNVDVFEKRFNTITLPSVLATTMSRSLQFNTLSQVSINDIAAGCEAGRYLLQKGHSNIGVIGGNPERSYISRLRYQGFCEAMEQAGSVHREALYQKASFSMESGCRAMEKLLARAPDLTAVFCMSDLQAVGAMRAIGDAGLRVPQDISVLGFDGISLGRYCIPRLASVRQPGAHIAQRSVELLLAQIEKAAPATVEVVDTMMVEGESVQTL